METRYNFYLLQGMGEIKKRLKAIYKEHTAFARLINPVGNFWVEKTVILCWILAFSLSIKF